MFNYLIGFGCGWCAGLLLMWVFRELWGKCGDGVAKPEGYDDRVVYCERCEVSDWLDECRHFSGSSGVGVCRSCGGYVNTIRLMD